MGISAIRIQNFKSIRDSGEVPISPLNVLIGPNGAGKSNFISFFKFLDKLYNQELQLYVNRNGRAENFLHFGSKFSPALNGFIRFDNSHRNEYAFELISDSYNNLIVSREVSSYYKKGVQNSSSTAWGGYAESRIKNDDEIRNNYLRQHLSSFRIFHFHDTGFSARIKQPCFTNDYAELAEDGGNLAAFLYRLQQTAPAHFRNIERIVKSIAPFFGGFYLAPDEINSAQIFLRWREAGHEQLFSAHNLSDGTLRMMCLATLLLQPEVPATVIIDEPELGLHPSAVSKLAGMLKSAADHSQIIISTQSVNLVSEFHADDIIVVERSNNGTQFYRQSEERLSEWLSNYSLGELWEKNLLGGRP